MNLFDELPREGVEFVESRFVRAARRHFDAVPELAPVVDPAALLWVSDGVQVQREWVPEALEWALSSWPGGPNSISAIAVRVVGVRRG